MDHDFVVQVYHTICWLNRVLRVDLDLYDPDFPKSTFQYLSFLVRKTHPTLQVFLFQKPLPSFKSYYCKKKKGNLVNNTLTILVCKIMNDQAAHNNSVNKLCIKKYALLYKTSTWRTFFENAVYTYMKIYPQNPIEPKLGAIYLNNKIRVIGLVLLVQLT